MNREKSEGKAQELLRGHIGSEMGIALAKFLNEIGRYDLIVEFYDQIDNGDIYNTKFLRAWLESNHPDILVWFHAKERLTQ
jgi:hypothetical protein